VNILTVYRHPSQIVTDLAVEGKARLQKLIDDVLASGVYISVSVDIWGENGISLFGILATFVDKECQLRNVLLRAAPMSTSRHTALNIWALLGRSLEQFGLAEQTDVRTSDR